MPDRAYTVNEAALPEMQALRQIAEVPQQSAGGTSGPTPSSSSRRTARSSETPKLVLGDPGLEELKAHQRLLESEPVEAEDVVEFVAAGDAVGVRRLGGEEVTGRQAVPNPAPR